MFLTAVHDIIVFHTAH